MASPCASTFLPWLLASTMLRFRYEHGVVTRVLLKQFGTVATFPGGNYNSPSMEDPGYTHDVSTSSLNKHAFNVIQGSLLIWDSTQSDVLYDGT